MANHTTVIGNLLSHLERSGFQKAFKEHGGDKRVRTLSTFDVLKTHIYGQVTSAFSVREIEIGGIAVSTQRINQALKTTILTRRTFYELSSHEVLPDIPDSNQLWFQGFEN
jgi:hypothetical protein